jgi:hypothetical protein
MLLLALPLHQILQFVHEVVVLRTILLPSTTISPRITIRLSMCNQIRNKMIVWTGTRLLKLYAIARDGNSKEQTDSVRPASLRKRSANGKRVARNQKRMSYGQRKAKVENGIEARL